MIDWQARKRLAARIFDKIKGKIAESIDTLPVNETAFEILKERRTHCLSGCEYVFRSSNQTRIMSRNLFRAFGIALKRAKIENFRFHDLRHTFATRLVQSGVGIYEVQKLGRWKNPSMVMRYAHHNPESLRASIEVMDRHRPGASTNLAHSQKKEGYKPTLQLVTP